MLIRPVRPTLLAAILVALSPGCTAPHADGPSAAEETAVLTPVHQFVEGFNAGDTARALAACTSAMSIIDEFPPFEWHGAGAATNWVADYKLDAGKQGITDGVVTLGKPRHVDIAGDRAYVVAPADYDFKQRGEPVKESGSLFTFALQKDATGWLISGWAWSRN